MDDSIKGIKTFGNDALNQALNQGSSVTGPENKAKTQAVGKDEFLKMLVTQLKNQDPMDPMKSDDFAVNLAQFSQLEQLIQINEQLQKGSGTDSSSLSSYLGREVTYNSNTAQVRNQEGGRVKFTLPAQASDVKIELVGADGTVRQRIDVGALVAGRQGVALSNLSVPDGDYAVRVVAKDLSGNDLKVDAMMAGVVTGFVPGADPVLLVGTKEIKPSEIKEVNVS